MKQIGIKSMMVLTSVFICFSLPCQALDQKTAYLYDETERGLVCLRDSEAMDIDYFTVAYFSGLEVTIVENKTTLVNNGTNIAICKIRIKDIEGWVLESELSEVPTEVKHSENAHLKGQMLSSNESTENSEESNMAWVDVLQDGDFVCRQYPDAFPVRMLGYQALNGHFDIEGKHGYALFNFLESAGGAEYDFFEMMELYYDSITDAIIKTKGPIENECWTDDEKKIMRLREGLNESE